MALSRFHRNRIDLACCFLAVAIDVAFVVAVVILVARWIVTQ